MLLRWALVYVLTVITLIMGGVVGWQRQLMTAGDERHELALEKYEALEAATIATHTVAQQDARQATEVRSQLENEKRSCETKLSGMVKNGESLAVALQASSAALVARDVAEERLADELKAKAADRLALNESRAAVEKLQLSAAAAVNDATTARAELARLQSQVTKLTTKETGSITPQPAPPIASIAPGIAAATTQTPAASVTVAAPPPVAHSLKAATDKVGPAPAVSAPAAATAPPPAQSSKATTDKTSITPGAVTPAAVPPVSNQKTTAKAKPAAKVTSAKPRAKSKPKSGDATFDASFF